MGPRLLVAHYVDGVAEVAVQLGHAVAVAPVLPHPAPHQRIQAIKLAA